MTKIHHPLTTHHKICECWGGNLKPNNTVMLRENVHRALHTVFQSDTPIQRLRRLIEVDKTTLHPDVYLAISNTLKRFEGEVELLVYDETLFNSDTFIHKLHQYAHGNS